MTAVLALDIGGTKLATAVVDDTGLVFGRRECPTLVDEGPDRVIERLFTLAAQSLAAGGVTIAAVGIGCGGPLDPSAGTIDNPPHLPGWDGVPVGPLAAKRFGVPFVLQNDGTAAAWGQYRFGAARDATSLVYLTVSTGIGGGVVIGGRLLRGAAGNGGEPGHIVVDPTGPACMCGRRGCLELYSSGSGIARRASDRLTGGAPSILPPAPSAADVVRAAQAGDAVARVVWSDAVHALGEGLTDIVNLVEPELVVLGGGVARAGELLRAPVADHIAAAAMRPAAAAVRVAIATRLNDVGLLGAAAIALDAIIEEQTRNPR